MIVTGCLPLSGMWGEKGLKTFFSRGRKPYFWKTWFYRLLMSWEINIITCTIVFRRHCGPKKVALWRVLYSKRQKMIGRFFFHRRMLPICIFFQKLVFSTFSYVLQKRSYNLQYDCQITLWSQIKYFLRSVWPPNTRKKRTIFILVGKIANLLKSCFCRPFRSQKWTSYLAQNL